MSGVATVEFRKYMLSKTFGLPTDAFPSFEVALTRQVPGLNAAINQLDEPLTKVGYGDVGRPTYGIDATSWHLINDTEVGNTNRIFFGTAGEFWGTLHGWALMTRADGTGFGRIMAVGTLNNPLKVVTGMRPFIEVENISFGAFD